VAALARKRSRWESIVREAAEQSHRGAIPAVDAPLDFAQAIQAAQGPKLLPWEAADGQPGLVQAMSAAGAAALPEVSLLIGPEGGLDDQEVAAAQAAGWQVVTLGSRILRAETAALAAITLVMAAAGEMGAQNTDPPIRPVSGTSPTATES
jgi:16S rRNA (uracil1498-N3)-methyltransferase